MGQQSRKGVWQIERDCQEISLCCHGESISIMISVCYIQSTVFPFTRAYLYTPSHMPTHPITLSLTHTVTPVTLSLSCTHIVTILPCHSFSPCHPLTLSPTHPVALSCTHSHCHPLTLSPTHTVTHSHCHTLTLSPLTLFPLTPSPTRPPSRTQNSLG